MGTYKDSNYYDAIYSKSESYRQHYAKSRYYSLWLLVMERIPQGARVLEVGCGTGQFAHFALDLERETKSERLEYFAGFDFSLEAVRMTNSRLFENGYFPQRRVWAGNALSEYSYKAVKMYDTIVCMEVFEHTHDKVILELLPKGKRLIFTVPDFDDPAHLRHFPTEADVVKRYGHLQDFTVIKHKRWYVVTATT